MYFIMDSERLFDYSYNDGIFNPTHGDGIHLFSNDFMQNFFQLNKVFEYKENVFEVHDHVIPKGENSKSPPIFVTVENGKCKNMRSMLSHMKHEDDELVYAIPIKDLSLDVCNVNGHSLANKIWLNHFTFLLLRE